jgi:formylglycine-generating enzyme required for sulfatase activity
VFAVGARGTIVHYDGHHWSAMSSSAKTGLLGVWGSSGSDVFAVGNYGAIVHYDGKGWGNSWQPPVTSDRCDRLWGVWSASGGDTFAVGCAGMIVRYEHASSFGRAMWSGTDRDLRGVWGNSERDAQGRPLDNVFAVGWAGTILHFDGGKWSTMRSGTTNGLAGVWGSSGRDVFAVGWAGTILHFDGKAWLPMHSGTSNALDGVWGSSAHNVFAVGYAGTVLHYDGNKWSAIQSGTSVWLNSVWGKSARDVFAVGDDGRILHYNGSNWSDMSSGTRVRLYGVWGRSGGDAGGRPLDDVFAVGDGGTILHYDGSASRQDIGTMWSAMDSGTRTNLSAVCDSSSGAVFAVGWDEIILDYSRQYGWLPVHTGTPRRMLIGIWGSTGHDVLAVAADGTVLHYDGEKWSVMNRGANVTLSSMWASSGRDVFAVGWDGTIVHYDGKYWAVMASGTSNNLADVWGSSSQDVFAVGLGGTILHLDGGKWSTMRSGTTNGLIGVWGSSGRDVFAVGLAGTILHFDGRTWSPMPGGTGNDLRDVWGSSGSDVFAVGYAGTILHYDGNKWSVIQSGTDQDLDRVWGTPEGDLFVVGGSGTILHYSGGNWSETRVGRETEIVAVWGSASNDVFVVGAAIGTGAAILHYGGSEQTAITAIPTVAGPAQPMLTPNPTEQLATAIAVIAGATAEAQGGPGHVQTREADGAEMVYVPAGEFQMGSSDADVDQAFEQCKKYDSNCKRTYFETERPLHTVALDAFWIDKYEVTNAQYEKCVAAGACLPSAYADNGQFNGDRQPVVGVSWDEATAYCRWVAGRLPTEAEWEKACRGTDGRIYPWGNKWDGFKANTDESGPGKTTDDVGSYPTGASPYGALDMAGNVWEWVADWYGQYNSGRQVNPTGPSSRQNRVQRGGSWLFDRNYARCAYRSSANPDFRLNGIGFRVVLMWPSPVPRRVRP